MIYKHATTRWALFFGFLCSLALGFEPAVALAHTKYLTCADFAYFGGSSSCSDTAPGPGTASVSMPAGTYGNTTAFTTLLAGFSTVSPIYVSGTVASGIIGLETDNGTPLYTNLTTVVDEVITGSHSSDHLYVENGVGVFESICISDTLGECGGYTPPENPFPSGLQVFGTSTTFQIQDNPNQDMANAIFIFFIGYFAFLFTFKRK